MKTLSYRTVATLAGLVAMTGVGTGALAPVANAAPTTTAATGSTTTTTSTTAVVKPGISLNVRSGPGTTYAIKGHLSGGTKITGTRSGTWFRITSGTYAGGYVSTDYLTIATATPPAPKPGKGQKLGYVMADPSGLGAYANIRSAASTTSTIVGHYAGHAPVVGTPVGDGTWWKTDKGYVNSATLTTATSNPSTINAKIPVSQMCVIPKAYYSQLPPNVIGYGYTTSTPRYIQCKALPNLIGLENAYKAHFGAYAGIDNAYRTWDEQKYWYGLYHPKGIAVAAPGKSNHGYGLAIDFQATYTGHPFYQFAKGHPGYLWLFANAGNYGFNNPYRYTSTTDDVHWNFVG